MFDFSQVINWFLRYYFAEILFKFVVNVILNIFYCFFTFYVCVYVTDGLYWFWSWSVNIAMIVIIFNLILVMLLSCFCNLYNIYWCIYNSSWFWRRSSNFHLYFVFLILWMTIVIYRMFFTQHMVKFNHTIND